jgi:uncharacterized membrane-anchored protein YitT (DUF2179 family)
VLAILAWAAVTVIFYRRYRRLAPFIVVHAFWDIGVFFIGWFTVGEAVVLSVASILCTAMWWHWVPPKPNAPQGLTQPHPWSGH